MAASGELKTALFGVLGVEADFERLKYRVASAISRTNHNRSCGTCNIPLTTRRDKAQCNVKRHARWQLTPSICRMKVECRVAIANARAPKASKIFDHFFRCCGSTPSRSAIKSTTANSSWFAPTMCGRSHTGSNLRQRYSRVGAINNKRSTQCQLLELYTYATFRFGAKDISMDDACKVRCASVDSTSCLRRWALAHEAFHKESRTTHAMLIVSQSALRAVWAAH